MINGGEPPKKNTKNTLNLLKPTFSRHFLERGLSQLCCFWFPRKKNRSPQEMATSRCCRDPLLLLHPTSPRTTWCCQMSTRNCRIGRLWWSKRKTNALTSLRSLGSEGQTLRNWCDSISVESWDCLARQAIVALDFLEGLPFHRDCKWDFYLNQIH